MSHERIIASLSKDFSSRWAKRTPIEWPNTPKIVNTEEYVRFYPVFFDTENAVIGGSVQRYKGILTVTCFTSVNIGYGKAYSLAEQAIKYMENRNIESVFTYAGSVSVVGKDPDDINLFVTNAKIPFESVL